MMASSPSAASSDSTSAQQHRGRRRRPAEQTRIARSGAAPEPNQTGRRSVPSGLRSSRHWADYDSSETSEKQTSNLQQARIGCCPDAAPAPEITDLLRAWRGGDPTALDRLTPLVYDHLRRVARQYVRRDNAERRFDATALVHDAYIRLVDARLVDWQDRAHFFAVTARIMRRILVDAARARVSAKRGGGFQRIDHSTMNLDELPAASSDRSDEICALNDALRRTGS